MSTVLTRFPRMTYQEALAAADATERWVFPELISSATTMIYGRSNVGKSYLVASMVLSLILPDREFLGVQPTEPTKVWRPVLLCTDPGSQIEYAERLRAGTGQALDVPSYFVGTTRRADEWAMLAEHLLDDGRNFVVLDNLLGATGDTNNSEYVSAVFDGLNAMVLRGVPAVVLHHESEHAAPVAGAPPMGMSNSVQKSRAWIQVRQTQRRGFRGGNTALIVQSNHLDQPREIIAEPRTGPAYQVISAQPWVARTDVEDRPKRDRSKETLDQNALAARYVVDECQGKGVRPTATLLAEKFPTRGSDAWRSSLGTGALSKMIKRDNGDTWQWMGSSAA